MKLKNAGKINYVTVNRLMYICDQQTYITGIVNLLYVRSDTKEKMSTTVTWKIVCCRCLAPPILF